MDRFQTFFFRIWRNSVLVLSLALITYLLYFHRLGSLLPGYSSTELHAYRTAGDWHHIFHNPINAPFSALVWLLTAVWHHGILATRIVSAVFGLGAALLFYAIARIQHEYRVSFLATILFATSAGLLHDARLGNGQILQMAVLVLIAAFLYAQRLQHDRRYGFGYLMAALMALLWYIPGMLWIELFGLAVMQGGLRRQLRYTPVRHLFGWIVTFLVVVSPLVYASVRNWHVALDAAGLPHDVHSLSHIVSRLLDTILAIGIHSNGSPVMWLSHVPLLNAVELVLGAFGAYYYLGRHRTARSVFLVGTTLLAIVLISLGGTVGYACLVPLLYLFISRGIDQLLKRWTTVFPRNPIARFTGVVVVCVMLFFSALYQVRAYYVAWPHAPATRQAFRHKG